MTRFAILASVVLVASACSFDDGVELGDELGEPGDITPDEVESEPGQPGEEPATENPSQPGAELPAGCSMVELTASRTYGPPNAQNASASLQGEREVFVPQTIQVVEGSAGDHCTLLFLEQGEDWAACAYKGESGGQLYRLVECRDESMEFSACGGPNRGEVIDPSDYPASRVSLEVNGSSQYGVTVATAQVGDCGPVAGDND
ncbi:MAG: hypothetical protein KJO07_07825 [Deltaproteobacteria bacterium]|jgi:hypothetical protein|nr:hypothetical protein [Deltaproteobacteria bacterium]